MTNGHESLPPVVVIHEPDRTPIRLVVDGPPIEVGRDCRGVLLTDPQISRRHLRLDAHAGAVRVSDLGSTNGTRVDGIPISGTHLLTVGEVVQLGASTITLFVRSTPATEPVRTAAATTSIDLVAAAVVADPPDLASLAAESGNLTIVFSDIESSTRRAVAAGDARWLELLEVHNSIVRRHLARHGGTEIKARGDGFMLSFASAQRAVGCMVDVQRALQSLARSRPTDGLRVRVGVHTGEATIGADGDPFGRHVSYAARVAGAARPGEILVSELVRQLVEPRGEFTFGASRIAALEGLGPDHVVHPVIWDDSAPRTP
jgi:class 3 adenylate cyclase